MPKRPPKSKTQTLRNPRAFPEKYSFQNQTLKNTKLSKTKTPNPKKSDPKIGPQKQQTQKHPKQKQTQITNPQPLSQKNKAKRPSKPKNIQNHQTSKPSFLINTLSKMQVSRPTRLTQDWSPGPSDAEVFRAFGGQQEGRLEVEVVDLAAGFMFLSLRLV